MSDRGARDFSSATVTGVTIPLRLQIRQGNLARSLFTLTVLGAGLQQGYGFDHQLMALAVIFPQGIVFVLHLGVLLAPVFRVPGVVPQRREGEQKAGHEHQAADHGFFSAFSARSATISRALASRRASPGLIWMLEEYRERFIRSPLEDSAASPMVVPASDRKRSVYIPVEPTATVGRRPEGNYGARILPTNSRAPCLKFQGNRQRRPVDVIHNSIATEKLQPFNTWTKRPVHRYIIQAPSIVPPVLSCPLSVPD